MDVKYINPFLIALKNVLGQLGVSETSISQVQIKESMFVEMDITAIIGLVGDLRGNIALSFSTETAKGIISSILKTPVLEIDTLTRSGIGELANMIAGNASILFAQNNLNTDITPPSIIFGKDIYFSISPVQTVEVHVDTDLGTISVDIGLEM
jgi:chemotaxis protein CheX